MTMTDPPPRAEPPSREELPARIAAGDASGAAEFLRRLGPGEAARALLELSAEDRARLLTMLRPEQAADVLRGVGDAQAADLVEDLSPQAAAAIVDELPSDEQADLLGEMNAGAAQAILDSMPRAQADQASRLMRYPPDSAGGLMVREFLAYREDQAVGELLADFHERRDRYADYDVQYIYIIDAEGRLVGVMRLRDILFSPMTCKLREVMVAGPASVRETEPLARLRSFLEEHRFQGLPVVDEGGRLLGVVHSRAVEEALERQGARQFLRFTGILGGEELRTMPLRLRSGRRLVWLTLNILLNFVPAGVVALYQDTVEAAVVLAVFLPIISNMAGCSGHQAVAVSIRELALGMVRPGEMGRVLVKESSLGVVAGLALGAILCGMALAWKGNPYLGAVVGVSLAVNTVVSVCVGGLLPLALRRLRVDPALLSGPILTAITDACGFFLVLSLASAVLPRLAGG